MLARCPKLAAPLFAVAAALACTSGDPDRGALSSQSSAAGDGPDFIVQSVSGPAGSLPGSSFQVTVTVCNQGTQPAGQAPTDIRLSVDSVITAADILIGSVPPSGMLEPGGCATSSVTVNPSVSGTYYLGAVTDPGNSVVELLETNNSKAGNRIAYGSKPDFTFSLVSGPASALAGSSISVTAVLCNQGTQSGSAPVHIYLSVDATITTADYYAGPLQPGGPSLAPGACSTLTGQVPANAPPNGAYYVGAIADRSNGVSELFEDNNRVAGNQMGLGNGPDLVISSVSTAPSVVPGGSLAVTAVLCNQGTQPGSAPVDIFLSTDATITTADFFAGPLPPGGPSLAPGACSTLTGQVPANAPPGVYYVGAIADRNNGLIELIESNNAAAGNRVAQGNGPDYVITQVTSSPSAVPGGQITVSATLCNQGTQPGDAPWVDLYLSTNATITTYDSFLGSPVPVPWLMPGACTTLSGNFPAPGSSGTLYVGAIADRHNIVSELRDDNNATAGNRVGIGYNPDIVITQVTSSPSALSGSQLTFTVTVCNQGTTPGSAPVEFFLSQDATITSSDFLAAPLPPAPYLQPGSCATQTTTGYAGVTDGIYYAGAIADRYNNLPELIDDNNATAGNRVGIGSRPDFIVTQVVAPPSAVPGAQVAVSVTVCNQGTTSGSPMVEAFLSTDAAITSNDLLMGPLPPAPSLAPGACATLSGNAYASGPSAAYYVGAIADRFNNTLELIEDNNAAAGNRFGLGNGPDMVVASLTAPPSATPMSSVTVSATVCNQGTMGGNAPVEIFFSADANITTSDIMAGMLPPPGPIPYGACATVSGTVWISAMSGIYYVGAIVDSYNGTTELIEDNNATAGNRIGVGSAPDLVITQVTAPPSSLPGNQVPVTVTVCNQGTQPGGAPVDLFFSSDATITSGDFMAGSLPPGPWLQPGACATLTGNAWAPPDGAYYVGAIADRYGGTTELIEDNNATAGTRIGVGYGPDVVITQVSAPPAATPGSQVTVAVTVCNQGTQPGGAPVDLYFSSDATITAGDLFAGSFPPFPSLAPGACTTLNGNAYLPTQEGVYYAGAIADRYNGLFELIEDNNATAGNRIGTGYRPDLVITSISSPASVVPGSPLWVNATVCNQGTQPGSAPVDVFFSTDAAITDADWLAGPLPPTPWLVPGACATLGALVYPSAPSGAYYLGGIVDRYSSVQELFEDNNARAGNRVGYGNGPDLVISTVSGPASAMSWSSINVTATVCNQGTMGGDSGPIDIFLSGDATITAQDTYAGTLPPMGWLAPGVCITSSGQVPAPAGPGTYRLGAMADRNNSILELIEDNNATAGGTIVLQ